MPQESVPNYDLIVIGGGPGGYVAAIKAAQLGLRTACVEKRERLGGTCLNIGCIPSKARLDASERYDLAIKKFGIFGVELGDVRLNLDKMMQYKETVVSQLENGVRSLFRKYKVDRVAGTARLSGVDASSFHCVEIVSEGEKKTLIAKNILLATGSESIELPFMPFDGTHIISSTEALSLPKVPKHMVIVGGGYVGLELGSVWRRLGSEVTVVEYQDRLLSHSDQQLAKELQKALTKQGIVFKLSTKCLGAERVENRVRVVIQSTSGSQDSISTDVVLVAVGRKPYADGLGLKELGIQTNEKGYVVVNKRFETSIPGVYAVGDVIGGAMLAHKASEEGVAAVEFIAGHHGYINYNAIPSVIYTWPELASVGATEEELIAKNIAFKKGSFPFSANARSRSMQDSEGQCKVLADAKNDRILGIHILGPFASELIHQATIALEFSASSEDIALICHAHPTLAEVFKEASMSVLGNPIHF